MINNLRIVVRDEEFTNSLSVTESSARLNEVQMKSMWFNKNPF